ncbi:hypothetical protein [Halobacillus salinus]|uniref:DUF4367 domain-containing protein n=1 Tax=Halobacillus salinus TaxID=192814 RepID=A0A4Z0H5T9_9BACI|nr:hypothetical protein [Halobacillus salinus]TGB05380.1 hypothetical protein E4663_10450 [Halobacillus salinus]
MERHSFVKLIYLAGLMILLTACGTSSSEVPSGYYAFQTGEEVETALDDLTFQPELPDFIPVHMVSVVSDIYEKNNQETLDISFYTEKNDLLSLTFTKGTNEKHWIDPQQVKIDQQLRGTYEDNQFAKRLSWKKNGITYTLAFRKSVDAQTVDEQSVSKEHLLEVARSFHS